MKTTQYHQENAEATFIRLLIILAVGFVLIVLLSAFRQPNPQVASMNDGEKVFNLVCKTCHQMEPPASMENGKPLAPPMNMILSRYKSSFSTPDDLKEALTLWLTKPDSTRSQLPPHAIQQHGLMPPLTISSEERTAVVDYLMSIMPEQGMDHMQGMMNGDMKGKMNGEMKGKMGESNEAKHQHKKQM